MSITILDVHSVRCRGKGWILSLVIFFSLLVSLGAVGVRTNPDGDIPTWYNGDQWTYTVNPLYFSNANGSFTGSIQNFRQTVLGIIGDAYKVNLTGHITGQVTMSGVQGPLSGNITGTSYVRVSDLAQETTVLHSRGTIIILFIPVPYRMDVVINSTPALESIDFPVSVGKQWHISTVSTTTGSFTITGIIDMALNATQSVNETVQCDSLDQISVPAGTFTCYNITRQSMTSWYSVDAGNTVKSIVDQSGSTTVQATVTLQAFSRHAQPITVSEVIEPSVTLPGTPVVISGRALNTSSGTPMPNADVTIVIPSLSLTWATMTDTSGYYTKTITAPTMIDDTPSGRETGSGGVIVQCTSGGLTGYRVKTLVTLFNTAPSAPSIHGPSQGKPGTTYKYVVLAADPEGDPVFYFIEWGDGTNTSWLGPYTSNTSITQSHTFTKKGTYVIKAKARDAYGAESGWGTLEVKMPVSNGYLRHPIVTALERFFERHPHGFPFLRALIAFLG